MNNKILVILIPLLIVNLSFLGFGLYQYSLTIPTSGTTDVYGLESDPDSIYWGNTNISEAKFKSVNLTNTGNTPLINLNLTTSGVVGLRNFALTWNLEGSEIQPDETLKADFTLILYEVSQKDWIFNIKVNGD